MLTSFIKTAAQFLQYTTNTFITKIMHINCQVMHYLCQNKGNGGHHWTRWDIPECFPGKRDSLFSTVGGQSYSSNIHALKFFTQFAQQTSTVLHLERDERNAMFSLFLKFLHMKCLLSLQLVASSFCPPAIPNCTTISFSLPAIYKLERMN